MAALKNFLTNILILTFGFVSYAIPYKILDKPEYIDKKDGTILDKQTQLQWSKSCDTNNDGKIDAKDKLTLSQAIEYAKNSRIGSYTDWRLPNIRELYSLIDFDGLDVNPTATSVSPDLIPFIDTKFFDFAYGDLSAGERIIDAQFATTSIYTASTMYGSKTMFGVNFADGRIKGYGYEPKRNRQKTFYVYLVRGNTEYSKNIFVDNKDGTISDLSTNLMWTKNDSKKGLNWQEANDAAQNLNFGGYSDWRLPTAKELQSIVDYSRSPDYTDSAAINPIFNCTRIINEAKQSDFPSFWTSNTHKALGKARGESACYVCFGRAMGYMNNTWLDVHGAGAQRSDPKSGDPTLYPQGRGPQGDALRIYNYLRPVRDILPTDKKEKPSDKKAQPTQVSTKKLPNIILFIADDFGFGSLNVNGASQELLQTPNMNALAKDGMNFTNVQSASSVCSPTRYALLTGIYPWRIKEHQAGVWGHSPQLLTPSTFTIQKMLKEKGYTTAMFGKWHLGFGTNSAMPDFRNDHSKTGINSTGFDYSWAIPASHGDISGIWLENDKIWGLRSNENVYNGYCSDKQRDYHYYDAPQRKDEEVIETISTKVINWIKSLDQQKPFFIYLASPAIHEPITPSAKNKGKSKIGSYGDFIMDLDDSLGSLMSYLKSTGQYDDTLIIFTSDNGAVCPREGSNRRRNPNSPRAFMFEFQDAGFSPNGNLNNGKSSAYEGGTRIPFILKWAGKVPQNKTSDELFGLVDVFSTIASVVGYNLNTKTQALDSQNIFNIWQGQKGNRQNLVTISQGGVRTIRSNGLKYIDGINREALTGRRIQSKGNTYQPEALYDLNSDLSEKNSILNSNPEKASTLKKTLKNMEFFINR